MEEKRKKQKIYIIWLCNLYYLIRLYIKIRIEMFNILLNKLIKKIK